MEITNKQISLQYAKNAKSLRLMATKAHARGKYNGYTESQLLAKAEEFEKKSIIFLNK